MQKCGSKITFAGLLFYLLVIYTATLRRFIDKFLAHYKIKTILSTLYLFKYIYYNEPVTLLEHSKNGFW